MTLTHHKIVLQSIANFVFSAVSALHLKAEVQEVEEIVEDQEKAIVMKNGDSGGYFFC